ncbi:hypothetical protein ABZ783_24645 [Micromonospora sp. NPDC047738]|uniref:hypothetical protein n=1 Tax=Micromonospora sp. NPDC047738 TaxID=3155741 RepID=UPI0033FFC31A
MVSAKTTTEVFLVMWFSLVGLPGLNELWSAMRGHLPDWLNTPFVAAVIAGLVTQWAFSILAASQSRRLNAETGVALDQVEQLVRAAQRQLAEISANTLTFKATLMELNQQALSASAPDTLSELREPVPSSAPAPHGADGGDRSAEPRLDGDLRQVVDELVDEAGGTLVLRTAYERLRPTSLQNLLYAIYWLRDVGRIAWDDAVIGWETELRRVPDAGNR